MRVSSVNLNEIALFKSGKLNSDKIQRSYKFSEVSLKYKSIEIETKNFKLSVEMFKGVVISKWRAPRGDYSLHDVLSKEARWIVGFVQRESGMNLEATKSFLKDLLKKLSKDLSISEDYIASTLRKYAPTMNPQKLVKLAKEIKLFFDNILGLIKLHSKSEEASDHVEILSFSFRRIVMEAQLSSGEKSVEGLA